MKNILLPFLLLCLLSVTSLVQAGVSLERPLAKTLPLKASAEFLHPGQEIKVGDYSLQITALQQRSGLAATGEGQLYLPLLDAVVPVLFAEINVSTDGELLSGEIKVARSAIAQPTYASSEKEVLDYLRLAHDKSALPFSLNTSLEAKGLYFGGHDLVLTDLTITKDQTLASALLMVQNLDGTATTFGRENILLATGNIDFCDLSFPILDGDQTAPDPEFPLRIKGYDPLTGEGTYVTFSCEGFNQFRLSAEYWFDAEHLKPAALPSETASEPVDLPQQVVASFEVMVTTWGQFMVENINFNGPFEVVGADDVIIEVTNAGIDYDDTNALPGFPMSYLDNLPNPIQAIDATNTATNIWRGFFVENIKVHLPESIAIGEGNSRILINAHELIYDRANGLSITVSKDRDSENTHLAAGSIEGWGLTVDTVDMVILYGSPESLDFKGEVQIPVLSANDKIGYAASFAYEAAPEAPPAEEGAPPPANANANTGVSVSFELQVNNLDFSVPLLQGASIALENSKAGFEYQSGTKKFVPYANLSGALSLDFGAENEDGTESGTVATDFKFPSLLFYGLTLNYDLPDSYNPLGPTDGTVVAGESGGLANMDIYAFGLTTLDPENPLLFVNGATPEPEEGAAAATPEKVSGFPITISEINFGSEGNQKTLDFNIALNFTETSVGLYASAGLRILGNLNAQALIDGEPWNALVFEGLQLNEIRVGRKEDPLKINGFSFYGGLSVIRKDATYGDGFKGFLVMEVDPGLKVEVMGQFGAINKTDGTLDYRYWFADAMATLAKPLQIGPTPIGLFSFGGGAFYNMEPQTALDDMTGTPRVFDEDAALSVPVGDELDPGRSLSGVVYTPVKNRFQVNAKIVIGTPFTGGEKVIGATANMDLVFSLSMIKSEITGNYSLGTIALNGDFYLMSPIDQRETAMLTGNSNNSYNHTTKLLNLGVEIVVAVEGPTGPIVTGNGNLAMQFNLAEGRGDEWYFALGGAPIEGRYGNQRCNLNIHLPLSTESTSLEGYFMAGNLNTIPAYIKTLPQLSDYHDNLANLRKPDGELISDTRQGKLNAQAEELRGGNAILMGGRYLYVFDKKFGPFYAYADFTIGFDAIMSQFECADGEPVGIDGWQLRGDLYGAMTAKVGLDVDLLFVQGKFNIAELNGAALLEAALPNPTWMSVSLYADYSILDGLVKGDFSFSAEVGEKCEPVNNLNPRDVIAEIKVIGSSLPVAAETVEIYRQKLVVITFLEPINKTISFADISEDGLEVQPYLVSQPNISGPNLQGSWRYYNENNVEVQPHQEFIRIEYNSPSLITANAPYNYHINVGWKYRSDRTSDNWVIAKQSNDVTPYIESRAIAFTAGQLPTTLPPNAITGSYPANLERNYCIFDNPAGGGIALNQSGWGYLFNPKKRTEGNSNEILEYNYFVRVIEASLNEVVFTGQLTAIPEPKYGCFSGDPILEEVDCSTLLAATTDNCTGSSSGTQSASLSPVIDWVSSQTGQQCFSLRQGPAALQQPDRANAQSNVRQITQYSWNFGDRPEYMVAASAGLPNRAIGFPDFSAFLLKDKVYRIQLVGIPIRDETITVSEEVMTIKEDGVTTVDGQTYIVSENSNLITGQFSNATEKILYEYRFATGQYNTFYDKLQAARNQIQLPDGSLFGGLLVGDGDYKTSRVSEGQVNLQDYGTYGFPTYVPEYLMERIKFRQLLRVDEGFGIHELFRLGNHAKFNSNYGYYQELDEFYRTYNQTWFRRKEQATISNNTVVGRSPFSLVMEPTGSSMNILPYATTKSLSDYHKQNALIYFYPRGAAFYKIYAQYRAESDWRRLTTSNMLPNAPEYVDGNLEIQYSTPHGTRRFEFGDIVHEIPDDLSGTYYFKNMGSGRYAHLALTGGTRYDYGTEIRTNYQFIAPAKKEFRLETALMGRHYIQAEDGGYLTIDGGFWGSDTYGTLKVYSRPSSNANAFFFLERQPDGTYLIKTTFSVIGRHQDDRLLLYEDPVEKRLKIGFNLDPDLLPYARFRLDETLNLEPNSESGGEVFFQGYASGRFWSEIDGKIITDNTDNGGTDFELRYRSGNRYEIWSTLVNRKLYLDDNYLLRSEECTNCTDVDYLFEINASEDGSGEFTIKSVATQYYLKEHFSAQLEEDPRHRTLLGMPTLDAEDNYYYFTQPTSFTHLEDPISGVYAIVSTGGNRTALSEVNGELSAVEGANFSFFIRRINPQNHYQIVHPDTGLPLRAEEGTPGSIIGFSFNAGATSNNDQFIFTRQYDDSYKIASVISSNYEGSWLATGYGNVFCTQEYNATNFQLQFTSPPGFIENGTYRIKIADTDMYLTDSQYGNVETEDLQNYNNDQLFIFTRNDESSNSYMINTYYGNNLHVDNYNYLSGGGDNISQFHLELHPDGTFRIGVGNDNSNLMYLKQLYSGQSSPFTIGELSGNEGRFVLERQ